MDPSYGKHSKRLAGFAGEIADARKAERKHRGEQDLARVALRGVKEERREAIIRGELGDSHRALGVIDEELAAAEHVVKLDEAGGRVEAMCRKVALLESGREAFVRDHAPELITEIVPASETAFDAVKAAMGALEDAVEHRAQVAADLHQVVRVLPVPNAGSTYQMFVPEDKVGGVLRGTISRARASIIPLVPWELAQGAQGERDDEAAAVDDAPAVKSAQERLDETLAEREREDAEREERAAEALAAAIRKTAEPAGS